MVDVERGGERADEAVIRDAKKGEPTRRQSKIKRADKAVIRDERSGWSVRDLSILTLYLYEEASTGKFHQATCTQLKVDLITIQI